MYTELRLITENIETTLKLIIIPSSQINIAEVSSRFHQAEWPTTLGIVYCYPISFLFWFICLSRNLNI